MDVKAVNRSATYGRDGKRRVVSATVGFIVGLLEALQLFGKFPQRFAEKKTRRRAVKYPLRTSALPLQELAERILLPNQRPGLLLELLNQLLHHLVDGLLAERLAEIL